MNEQKRALAVVGVGAVFVVDSRPTRKLFPTPCTMYLKTSLAVFPEGEGFQLQFAVTQLQGNALLQSH